jgi:hypothetical protein
MRVAIGAVRHCPMAGRKPQPLYHVLVQREFFGIPLGLGLATATTSAAFFPQFEQKAHNDY